MTTDQPAIIDADQLTVRRTVRITATLEKVWAAVTEPEHISQWFGEATLEGSRVGARGTLSWPDRGDVPLRVEAIDPPRMVSYRWSNHLVDGRPPETVDDDRSTVFTFTLVPVAEGVELTVVETGFETSSDPAADLESHRKGWDSELDELAALVEAGS